jgi:hypothetical protein
MDKHPCKNETNEINEIDLNDYSDNISFILNSVKKLHINDSSYTKNFIPKLMEFSDLFKTQITSPILLDSYTYDKRFHKTHLHNEKESIPSELSSKYDNLIMKFYTSLLQSFLQYESYEKSDCDDYNKLINNTYEIEFRLGKIENKKFNTNVSKIHFETILNGFLNNNKEFLTKFGKVSYTDQIDCFLNHNKKSYRTTLKNTNSSNNSNNSDVNIFVISKKKLNSYDFECTDYPFDIRLGVAKEEYIPHDKFKEFCTINKLFNKFNSSRRKERISVSFLENSYCFDFTIINSHIESVPVTEYEIEFEINPKKLKELYNITDSNKWKIMSIKCFYMIFELFSYFE